MNPFFWWLNLWTDMFWGWFGLLFGQHNVHVGPSRQDLYFDVVDERERHAR